MIQRFALLCCGILVAVMVLSCGNDSTSTPKRTEMWGVFKTEDGSVVTGGGEASTFSVCNDSYRSTAL